MIDFEIPSEIIELRERVSQIVRDRIVPYETDPRNEVHRVQDSLREEIVDIVRKEGLLSPHAPKEYGGLGLDHRGMAVVFEAAKPFPMI